MLNCIVPKIIGGMCITKPLITSMVSFHAPEARTSSAVIDQQGDSSWTKVQFCLKLFNIGTFQDLFSQKVGLLLQIVGATQGK